MNANSNSAVSSPTPSWLRFLLPALLLLILPAISYVSRAGTTSYASLAETLDPEWSYLSNAVLVAEGKAPGHIDHPGTPVQTLAALAFRNRHRATAPDSPFPEDVFSHAVAYLELGASATALAALATLALAAWIFLAAGQLFYVVFLLEACFLAFPAVQLELTRFKPDLWVGTSGVLAWSLFALAWKKRDPRIASALGSTLGFGLALKLNFLPFLLLPIFLPKELKRSRAYLAAFLSVILFTLPARARYLDMFAFLRGIATTNGEYGGTFELLDPNRMAEVGARLFGLPGFAGYLLYFAIFALLCGVLALGASRFRRAPPDAARIVIPALLVFGLNVLMVLRHPSNNGAPAARYLMPSLATAACLLPLTIQALGGRIRHALVPLFLFALAMGAMAHSETIVFFPPLETPERLPKEHHFFADRLFRESPCRIVLGRVPTVEAEAIDFANYWSHREYQPLLARLFPLARTFRAVPGGIRSFLGETKAYGEVRNDVRGGACYLILTATNAGGGDPAWDPTRNLATRDDTADYASQLGAARENPGEPRFAVLRVTLKGRTEYRRAEKAEAAPAPGSRSSAPPR